MKDAQLAEPHEISKELVAITPYNKTLVWNGEPARSELLVVIWTRSPDYDTNVGRTMRLTREVWVTVVPQVKDFCAQLQPLADVSFRLKQLLGLHPDNEQTKFVELWVRQDDLFRPSPDPEVTDQEAELEFPRSPRFIWVAPEHVAWFTALLGKSYTKDGYPWTRLGYTYDWGNPKSKVGLSEFIIKEGSSVGIHAVSLTEEYCRPRAS